MLSVLTLYFPVLSSSATARISIFPEICWNITSGSMPKPFIMSILAATPPVKPVTFLSRKGSSLLEFIVPSDRPLLFSTLEKVAPNLIPNLNPTASADSVISINAKVMISFFIVLLFFQIYYLALIAFSYTDNSYACVFTCSEHFIKVIFVNHDFFALRRCMEKMRFIVNKADNAKVTYVKTFCLCR